MAQIHTHYDNLKVARNAPPEITRAAYRAFSQKFHPDRNPDNSDAARIMAITNASYEVLSDPDKRREHDQWIKEVEAASHAKVKASQAVHSTTQVQPQPSVAPPVLHRLVLPLFNLVKGLVIWAFSYMIGIGILIGVLWIIGSAFDLFGGKSSPPPGPKPYQVDPASERSAYARPSTAPNGNPRPVSSGYVKDYQRLHADGLSTVTVDNG
ncbi:MAG: J domain-containing protein [Nitrospira sp.]|nr:J domain-containing protein [Nitrospira sp.]